MLTAGIPCGKAPYGWFPLKSFRRSVGMPLQAVFILVREKAMDVPEADPEQRGKEVAGKQMKRFGRNVNGAVPFGRLHRIAGRSVEEGRKQNHIHLFFEKFKHPERNQVVHAEDQRAVWCSRTPMGRTVGRYGIFVTGIPSPGETGIRSPDRHPSRLRLFLQSSGGPPDFGLYFGGTGIPVSFPETCSKYSRVVKGEEYSRKSFSLLKREITV